jgi:hypothetical protein
LVFSKAFSRVVFDLFQAIKKKSFPLLVTPLELFSNLLALRRSEKYNSNFIRIETDGSLVVLRGLKRIARELVECVCKGISR